MKKIILTLLIFVTCSPAFKEGCDLKLSSGMSRLKVRTLCGEPKYINREIHRYGNYEGWHYFEDNFHDSLRLDFYDDKLSRSQKTCPGGCRN